MIRTATPAPAVKTSPQRPYISTTSLILAPYTKGPPTVEVTTTHSVGVPLLPVDRTLKHQRTLRPTDFDRPTNTPSPVNLENNSPLPTRDAPPAPASSSPKRSSPDRSAEARAQTPSSGVQRISRSLRREKTLMPEDFSKAREQDSLDSPERSSSRTQREPSQTDAADPCSSRPRRGFATISLGPSADDQRRYSRSPTDTRHYTCWQRVSEFEDAHRQLAISADTAHGEVFQIQGVLVFSAFEDRSRGPHNEHPDSVFSVADVCIELRTYSRNSCAYAKETAEAPEYVDVCRRADSLIKVAFDANERKWRLGSSGRGHAAPVSCSFNMGIPVHLFRSAKERYFRVTARVDFEVGPRHPLSYNASGSGGCKSSTVQLACATSDPVDFTVSYLALPRSP